MSKQKQETIVFTRAYKVQAASGAEYQAGQEVTLPEPSALHFINRNAAVLKSDATAAKSEETGSKASKKKVTKKAASKKAG